MNTNNAIPTDAELTALGYCFAPCPGCGVPELLHAAALGLCPRCLAERQEEAEAEEWARAAAAGVCPECLRGTLPEDREYGWASTAEPCRGCRCPRGGGLTKRQRKG